jgi:hypothetical protein
MIMGWDDSNGIYLSSSVADPGFLFRILSLIHPGSLIPGLGSQIPNLGSQIEQQHKRSEKNKSVVIPF